MGPSPGEEERKIMFESRINGRSKTERKEKKNKTEGYDTTVFLNRRAEARYPALASTTPGRERPEETTICYQISLVQ